MNPPAGSDSTYNRTYAYCRVCKHCRGKVITFSTLSSLFSDFSERCKKGQKKTCHRNESGLNLFLVVSDPLHQQNVDLTNCGRQLSSGHAVFFYSCSFHFFILFFSFTYYYYLQKPTCSTFV